jgi:hypothetical protein
MANKPASDSPAGNPIRTRVLSTEAGQTMPTLAANVAAISRDAGGLVLTFYSVPSDALDTPSVKEQIQRGQKGGPGAIIDVTVQAQPAVKLFLPITTAAGLAQLLNDNLRAWTETYGRELRSFLDSAHVAAEGAAAGDGGRKGPTET